MFGNCNAVLIFQEAMEKDNMEHASEPNLNLKSFLANAYLHPIFHLFEEAAKEEETVEVRVDKAQKQQQQHHHREAEEEAHVRSSSQYHEESHFRSTHETHYHHEESQYSRSTQYHEGIHVRSDMDSPSPPHFVYHYDIQP
jgi:hypothetical protein